MQFKIFRLLLLLFLCISCSDEDSNPEQPMQAENEINISALPVSSGFNNDIIIIEGENFNEFANEIVIKFSSTQAEILEILASQITVKVPLSLSVGIHTILLEYNEEILTVGEFTILQETEILTASSNGKIYSVGASTGSYDLIGEVDYEFLSFLLAINIIYDGENVYFFDTYGDEINQIIKYNLENESTIVQQLSFPDAVEGSYRGISSWVYDNVQNKIVATVNEDIINSFLKTNYVITIDPVSFETSYDGVSFEQVSMSSNVLIDDKLVLTAPNDNHELTVVDLSENSVEHYEISESFKLNSLVVNDDSLYAFKTSGTSDFGDKVVALDTDSFSIQEFIANNETNYVIGNLLGNSFYSESIIYKSALSIDSGYGLLKYNAAIDEYTATPYMDDDLEINIRFLDIIED